MSVIVEHGDVEFNAGDFEILYAQKERLEQALLKLKDFSIQEEQNREREIRELKRQLQDANPLRGIYASFSFC